MDKITNDIKLGATVIVGILTVYVAWTAYNNLRGSSSLENA